MCSVVAVPLAALLTAASLLAMPAQQPTFRTGVQTVPVYATVRDGNDRLAPNLTREDFEILDNGKPVAITSFSNDPQPLTVALLLDLNWGTESRLLFLRESTQRFIDTLLPVDRLRIGTLGVELALSSLLTGNKDELRRVVREEFWADEESSHGVVPIWGGIDAAMTSLEGESGRRVVLLLGRHRPYNPTQVGDEIKSPSTPRAEPRGVATVTGLLPQDQDELPRVWRRAVRQDFMLYALHFGAESPLSTGSEHPFNITGLVQETGGGYGRLADDADLRATFTQVAEELRHQYALSFTPPELDGREHKLEVRIRRPGYTARARRSYVAADVVNSRSTPAPQAASPPQERRGLARAPILFPTAISARVTQADATPVAGLSLGDFQISIGGRPYPIGTVSNPGATPLTVVVLTDLSLSVQSGTHWPARRDFLRDRDGAQGMTEPGLALTRNDFRDFVNRIIANLRPGDRARLGSVARVPTLGPIFTDDRRALATALGQLLDIPASPSLDSNLAPLLRSHPLSSSQRGPSPIWDALDMAVTTLVSEPGHRAIVLVTDGHATGNRFSVTEVGQRAMLTGVSIHIVGARDAPYLVTQTATTAARVDPRTNLQWLADITGGSFSSMADRIDPDAHATRVVRDLHSTYLLDISGASAPPGDTISPIEVRVNRPGVTVRTPKGYGGMSGSRDPS